MIVDLFKMRQRYEASQAVKVVRDATNVRGVKTDDSSEHGGFEASKATTVTRMATPRGHPCDGWHF